jgi:hypothetical protein
MRGANLRGYGDSGGVTLIVYEGEVVASVGARRVCLAPQVDKLDDGEPLLRFVCSMAAYALAARDGSAPGPYTHARAELFARLALIDDDQFEMLDANGLPEELLAGHFGVPLEQVARKRQDLSARRGST